MKTYVLMTSMALLAGTAIGYFSGKDTAADQFASACTDAGFAVVYDHRARQHRSFHCFELNLTEDVEPATERVPRDAFVL